MAKTINGCANSSRPRSLLATLRPQIKQITTELLDALAARPDGELIDLRADYAEQVPLRVITAMMGVPADLQAGLRVCVDDIFSTSPQRDPQTTLAEMVSILTTLVARRRAEPGEDMTSLLIGHRDDSDRLTEEELVHTLLLVISAGYETTVNLIDQAICQLLTHRQLSAQLRTGAATWSALIEETLRYAPPVANLPLRYAVVDIDIDGQRIAAGEAIVTSIAAATAACTCTEPMPTSSTRPGRSKSICPSGTARTKVWPASRLGSRYPRCSGGSPA